MEEENGAKDLKNERKERQGNGVWRARKRTRARELRKRAAKFKLRKKLEKTYEALYIRVDLWKEQFRGKSVLCQVNRLRIRAEENCKHELLF